MRWCDYGVGTGQTIDSDPRSQAHTRKHAKHLIQARQRLDTQVFDVEFCGPACPALSDTALTLGVGVYESLATEHQDLYDQLIIFRFEVGAVATKLLYSLPQCRLHIVVR